jgi:hypothetical protein
MSRNTTTSRRALLAGAPAVAAAALAGSNALAIAEAKAAEVDPIFAAIERHRAAEEVGNSRCSALDEAGTAEAEEELGALYDAIGTAEDELRETEPTTIAGAVALLRYVARVVEHGPTLGHLLDPTVLADALAKIEGAQS